MAVINPVGKVPELVYYRKGSGYVLHDALKSDSPKFYKELLSQARSSICIIDQYAFENNALSVFESIASENIKVYIYTIGYNEARLKEAADNIKHILNQKISNFQLTIISYRRLLRKEQYIPLWHDRYLIIDNKDYYLVGNSLDGQQTSEKFHGIYHLQDSKDKAIVSNLYDYYKNSYNNIRACKITRN